MNELKKTYIAYRCPECGSAIDFFINIFQLSGKGFEMSCPNCHGSKMHITRSADSKVRLNVPCLVCPHPHPYTLSDDIFFGKELFALQCSFTGMDICFMGDEALVIEAMRDNEELLSQMMEEDSFDDGDENTAEIRKATSKKSQFENSFIMFDILTIIKDLIVDEAISCKCDKTLQNNLSVSLSEKDVKITCKKCGASITVPTCTERDLNNAIDMEEIVLE